MNWIIELFKRIGGWFSSDKGQKVVSQIQGIYPVALLIVREIAVLTGNNGAMVTIDAVDEAYKKLGVPLLVDLQMGNKLQVGNALQDLAVILIQRQLPTVPTSVAKTAVNAAVVQVNGEKNEI